jgi:DNA repair protein RadC
MAPPPAGPRFPGVFGPPRPARDVPVAAAVNLAEATLPRPAAGLRERALLEGVRALGDAELLTVVLGTGLAGRPASLVAAGLLDRFGGLAELARIGPALLAEHPGVGQVKALRVAAALELGARVAQPPLAGVVLSSSAQVAAHMAPRLATLTHEELWVLCLNGQNRLRALRRVAQGGVSGATVQPRDVLRAAIYEAAVSVIVVHNHPSGDPAPSPEDLALTRRLVESAAVVGVPVLDHVIVTPDGRYCSLLDLGVIER